MRTSTMLNSRLETFIGVANAGSFSKASENIFITPPAIIKQINLLESELGFKLFTRTHQGLTLTESGKSFYDDVKYIIQYYQDSIKKAKYISNNRETIRIGTSLMTPAKFLIDLWPQIYKYCPDLKFEIISYENTPENANQVRNFGKYIDLTVGVLSKNYLISRNCDGTWIFDEPIRCAVPIRHKLSNKNNLTIQDLYGENLMIIKRNWNSYIDSLRSYIIENHPKIHIQDFDFYGINAFNECENTNSIILTIDRWKEIHPLLKVIPVQWNYSIPFGILHSLTPSENVQRFLEVIRLLFGTKPL